VKGAASGLIKRDLVEKGEEEIARATVSYQDGTENRPRKESDEE